MQTCFEQAADHAEAVAGEARGAHAALLQEIASSLNMAATTEAYDRLDRTCMRLQGAEAVHYMYTKVRILLLLQLYLASLLNL